MAMTEAEAKTKWCPFVRYEVDRTAPNRDEDSNGNDGDPNKSWNKCIGSHCMAWRWSRRGMVEVPEKTFGPEAKSIMSASDAALLKQDGTPVPDLGYCGMAGRL